MVESLGREPGALGTPGSISPGGDILNLACPHTGCRFVTMFSFNLGFVVNLNDSVGPSFDHRDDLDRILIEYLVNYVRRSSQILMC